MVVDPIHTSGVPLTVTVGLGFTVTGGVVAEHPVAELVKVNVAEPCAKPVTTPELNLQMPLMEHLKPMYHRYWEIM